MSSERRRVVGFAGAGVLVALAIAGLAGFVVLLVFAFLVVLGLVILARELARPYFAKEALPNDELEVVEARQKRRRRDFDGVTELQ
jgi:hypothetical protein